MSASDANRLAGVRRLGLLGGSFDPVHVGHLHVARAAAEAFDLDHVLFVPAARPPHKPERVLAEGADRLALVELALAEEPRFSASDLELRRAGPSFTIDTVRDLPRTLGLPADARVHLLVGDDNLQGLPTWREVEALLAAVQPVVIHRGEQPGALLAGLRGKLSEAALARLAAGILHLPPVPVSSTDLRARLAAGADVSGDLPAGVGEYIRARGIYGAAP